MKKIDIKQEDLFLEIKLNDPLTKNSISRKMITDLSDLFKKIDKNLKCIFLSHRGDSFCSGLNLKEVSLDQSFFSHRKDALLMYEMFELLSNCPIPIYTYLKGNVYGGAFGFLGISDVVYAHSHSQFCFSEVRFHLTPSVIYPFLKERIKEKKEFLYSGKRFNSNEALKLDLVDQITDLDYETWKSEKKIELKDFSSLKEMKKLMRNKKSLIRRWIQKQKSIYQIAKLKKTKKAKKAMEDFLNKK